MTTIQTALPEKFVSMCERHAVKPEFVIQQFIRDLCSLQGSSGSDERLYAQLYYERCGYAFMAGVEDDIVPERLSQAADGLAALAGMQRPRQSRR